MKDLSSNVPEAQAKQHELNISGNAFSACCEYQALNKGAVLALDRHLRKGRQGNQNR